MRLSLPRLGRCAGFLAAGLLSACAHTPGPRNIEELAPDSAQGISAILSLPPELEPSRAALAAAVVRARQEVAGFGTMHGWTEQGARRTFSRAEVFTGQLLLWRRMLELNRLPLDRPLPTPGLAAGIEGGVLLAVSPEEYARVAPEYAALPDAWMRLVAHELAHRFHVEILGGDEEAMGPVWFYEGFATLVAGQALDEGLRFESAQQALAAARDAASPLVYRRYVAAVRYFAARLPVPELVARAGKPDFEAWLETAAPK